jgi:hypothetical protein
MIQITYILLILHDIFPIFVTSGDDSRGAHATDKGFAALAARAVPS